ncbi:hypothetical protein [Paenibacillus urinalis]|uniref:DUF2935 domain-containing protein n=1 Tax=Paenibacillus urinalis TaxID=521520 RepID=A0AAX3MT85_9BACL|nr:hypothetical protein [Paenibacillus urinalis]WDH80830.1 hypothetical protein PUW23_14905 [Paenibacillus urinalis]
MGLFKKITSLFGTNEHKPNPKKRIETPEFIYSHNLPEHLGIMSSVHSLNRLAARLEDALNDTYMNQVRDRVMSKHRYTAEKYNWMLLELKRYFILCSVLKNVPMYSNDTDVIWHEMLMFTRDYEDFCRKFTGDFIHHQPHSVQPSEAERVSERSWYDLLYSRLFIIFPENEQLSRAFFKHPIEEGILRRIEHDPNDAVITSRLRVTNDLDVKQLQEELLLTLSLSSLSCSYLRLLLTYSRRLHLLRKSFVKRKIPAVAADVPASTRMNMNDPTQILLTFHQVIHRMEAHRAEVLPAAADAAAEFCRYTFLYS